MSKKILITGQNSYIGTSFIHYCERNNSDFIIDELNIHGDCWKSYDFSQYSIIFHVAGIAHNSSNKKLESLYYSVNRDLTLEVAKKAKKEGVKQFIFMSSMIVFGNQPSGQTAITRETVPNPDNFYGDSKLQAEKGLEKLQSADFKVAIVRPPMIYGKGSKGNYPLLAKLAQKTPIFPDYPNKRSMIHIDNLCVLIYLIIENNDKGKFHPQNAEYVQTSQLVKQIAEYHIHKIWLTKLFNPLISIGMNLKLIRKIFGSLFYDLNISVYKDGNYQLVDLKESIIKTEK